MSDSDQQGTVSDSEADIGVLEVRNRADLGRYELLQDGGVVGHADYSVSYTHLTLPTRELGQISVVGGPLKKKKRPHWGV